MVSITKEESIEIRKRYPGVSIVRTMKGHSDRHRYCCEEDRRVMQYLNRSRRYKRLD